MYYENNNIKLYYEEFGNNINENIIILPGWGDNRKSFYEMINLLKEKYKVYIFDYPGFGNSPFPNKDLTIYDYENLFENFIKEKKLNKLSIICHSFGGRITILLNSKVKIEKQVFIDIAGIRRKSLKRYIKKVIYKLKKKLVILLPKDKRITYLLNLRKKYSSSDYISLNKNMYNTFKNIINEDLRKYIKKINTRTLIIWGEKDNDTKIRDAYFYNKHIKKSNLIIFKNLGHFSYLEEKNINEIILKFINK